EVGIGVGNLVRNGGEAMASGGRLSVDGRPAGDCVEVAVTDTGVGIPPEHLARVMEPLYSTKARGLGLGLAIARSVLQKNNGSLSLTSEPGRATTFTVRLPAAPP